MPVRLWGLRELHKKCGLVAALALLEFVLLVGFTSLTQGQTPTLPGLASPENGELTNDNTPYFSWDNLTGENILYYRLVVDNDLNFVDADNFYDNTDLTDNFDNFGTHTENALPEGTWYWHVRGENATGPGAWSETRTLTVDVTRPTVQISVNRSLIFDNYVGTNNFVVTATFSENMDNAIALTITFTPDVRSDTLENVDFAWTVDNSVCTWTYDVDDEGVENADVNVMISGGKDLAGNDQVDNTGENMFDIDTQNPTVVSAVPSPTLIFDNHVGADNFTVTITFNENMNEAVNPDLAFTPDVSTTLENATYSWTDNLTCVVTYDVADAAVNVIDIDIKVENAVDDNGNVLVSFDNTDAFDIDTQNPTVVSVTPNDTLITDADVGTGNFTVTVIYSENMDETVDPDIEFIPAVSTTLTFSSGSWTDNLTYVATYNIADAGVNVVGVDVLVENAQDDNADTQVSYTETDAFDIDTQNPTVTTLTAPANGAFTNDSTPTCDWESVSGTASYTIQYATDSGFTQNLTTGSSTASDYTPTAALADGTWYWRVRTVDAVGNTGDWSSTWSFTIDTATPTVTLSPSLGATPTATGWTLTTTNSSIEISGSVGDATGVTVKINDKVVPVVGGSFSKTANLVVLGTNTFTIAVTDAAGNTTTRTLSAIRAGVEPPPVTAPAISPELAVFIGVLVVLAIVIMVFVKMALVKKY